MSCDKCKWGQQAPIDPNNIAAPRAIICMRMPPQTVPIPTEHGIQIATMFPRVSKEMVCGEFNVNNPQ